MDNAAETRGNLRTGRISLARELNTFSAASVSRPSGQHLSRAPILLLHLLRLAFRLHRLFQTCRSCPDRRIRSNPMDARRWQWRGRGLRHCFRRGCAPLQRVGRGDTGGELGGDLEAIEEEAGSARVHVGRVESAEDLRERDLDAAGVFNRQQVLLRFRAGGIAQAMKVGVVIAEWFVAEGRGVAFLSARHDVSAFVIHGSL